ncbi:hypothetical protein THAOC_01707 [Thalassiosira oceanica]|uniref:Uncharacterized protein n=1 Tax=Thalassiosira oceanica TaxID=159749 RepID=K0TGH9_THAOC|nr:hypothetical protein THAOC_01707 [Thalassiosira oceanica]|eukprot:EJK76525.1 hypothetical protein THAOC_01707 [Thalassiosira oceanica]
MPFCRAPTPDSDAAGLALVQKRVDAKDPKAMEFLADAYFRGVYGLEQDSSRAIELWTDATRLGDLDAHFSLGYWYYDREGVEEDVARGVQHWQHAAIQGHPNSRFMLGAHEYENGNHELAVQHWMITAKMGGEDSLNNIKAMFMKGYATKAQYAEALRGYQNALEETRSPQREQAKALFGRPHRRGRLGGAPGVSPRPETLPTASIPRRPAVLAHQSKADVAASPWFGVSQVPSSAESFVFRCVGILVMPARATVGRRAANNESQLIRAQQAAVFATSSRPTRPGLLLAADYVKAERRVVCGSEFPTRPLPMPCVERTWYRIAVEEPVPLRAGLSVIGDYASQVFGTADPNLVNATGHQYSLYQLALPGALSRLGQMISYFILMMYPEKSARDRNAIFKLFSDLPNADTLVKRQMYSILLLCLTEGACYLLSLAWEKHRPIEEARMSFEELFGRTDDDVCNGQTRKHFMAKVDSFRNETAKRLILGDLMLLNPEKEDDESDEVPRRNCVVS